MRAIAVASCVRLFTDSEKYCARSVIIFADVIRRQCVCFLIGDFVQLKRVKFISPSQYGPSVRYAQPSGADSDLPLPRRGRFEERQTRLQGMERVHRRVPLEVQIQQVNFCDITTQEIDVIERNCKWFVYCIFFACSI